MIRHLNLSLVSCHLSLFKHVGDGFSVPPIGTRTVAPAISRHNGKPAGFRNPWRLIAAAAGRITMTRKLVRHRGTHPLRFKGIC